MINNNIKSAHQAVSSSPCELKIGTAFKFSPIKSRNSNYNSKSNCNDSSAASSGDCSYSDNDHAQTKDPKTDDASSIFTNRGVQFIQDLYKYVQEQAQVIQKQKSENSTGSNQQQSEYDSEEELQQLYMNTHISKKFMTKICQPFLNGGHCELGNRCQYLHVSKELRQSKLNYLDILKESASLTQQRNAWICGNVGDGECHWVNIKTWNQEKHGQKQKKGRLPCFHHIQSQFQENSSEQEEGIALEDITESAQPDEMKHSIKDQSGQKVGYVVKRHRGYRNKKKVYDTKQTHLIKFEK